MNLLLVMCVIASTFAQESELLGNIEYSRGLHRYFVADREFEFSFTDSLPVNFFNSDSYRRLYVHDGIRCYFPTVSRAIDNSRLAVTFDDGGYENYSFFLRNSSTTASVSFFTRAADGSISKEAKNYYFDTRFGRHSATFFLINQSVEFEAIRRDTVFAYVRYGFEGNGFGVSADRELVKQLDGEINALDHGRLFYKNIACDIRGLEGLATLRGSLTAKFDYTQFKTTLEVVTMGNDMDVNFNTSYMGAYITRQSFYDWLGDNRMRYNEAGYRYNDYFTAYIRHVETMRHGNIACDNDLVAGVLWSYPVPLTEEFSIAFDGDVISDPAFFSTAHTSLVYSKAFFQNDLRCTAFIRNNFSASTVYAPSFMTWDAYIDALLISARFFVLTENIFHHKFYDYNGYKGEGFRVKFGLSWTFYN